MGTIGTSEIEIAGHKLIVTLFTQEKKGKLMVKARARMKRSTRPLYKDLLEFYLKSHLN